MADSTKTHIFIPDTQVREGVPLEHLEAAGLYVAEQLPDVVVVAGDWWDMPSLSSYETKGSKYFHDKSYKKDIVSGNIAMNLFMAPIHREIAKRKKNKKKHWNPRLVFTVGNHEYRIQRAINETPILEGTIGYDDFNLLEHGFEIHEYQHVVEIDGILYSHNFVNQKSLNKNLLGGSMDNRLSKIMRSFTMGHQQVRMWGTSHDQLGRELCGLVAGAFYQHDEDYVGPQGNHYWRGIVVKHEVENGSYDPMWVSMNYLLKNYA